MRYRELAQRLRELGCEEMRSAKGSHRIWHNPVTGQLSAIPDWGARDLTPGTVRAVIRELGIARREFGPIQ